MGIVRHHFTANVIAHAMSLEFNNLKLILSAYLCPEHQTPASVHES